MIKYVYIGIPGNTLHNVIIESDTFYLQNPGFGSSTIYALSNPYLRISYVKIQAKTKEWNARGRKVYTVYIAIHILPYVQEVLSIFT